MTKTIAELRMEAASGKAKPRPERAVPVCLRPDLVAKAQELQEQLHENAMRRQIPAEDDAAPRSRKRIADPLAIREQEIREALANLSAEMEDYSGTLTLRATKTDGEWRRFCLEHPSRPEVAEDSTDTAARAAFVRDQTTAAGYCNADDLIDDLGAYVIAWEGEPLATGDWEILADSVAGGDKKELARQVVYMYEAAGPDPKAVRALSVMPAAGTSSTSLDA